MRAPVPRFRQPDDAGPRPLVQPSGAAGPERPVDSADQTPLGLLVYGVLGAGLGLVFVEGQVLSWFRIYEMFRFESVHMYGVIGSAVATAAASLWALRRWDVRTLHGEPVRVAPKEWGGSRVPGARYWMGGLTFGLGWALLGACPGPVFALLGGGVTVMAAALVAALAGTWTYAALRDRLPH